MPTAMTTEQDQRALRLFERAQRIFGRLDDLPALLDLVAQTLVKMLEEIEPAQANAAHVWGAAGLISRRPGAGVFRPLRLKGRPDPEELRSFAEHVGPGDSRHPTGLMGWSAARRMVALRRGAEWFVADRDDEHDRWAGLRAATAGEAEEMKTAAIAAYRSVSSQLAVPVLDPEIRGQARPRPPFGILSVESDERLGDDFCRQMIAFAGSIGYPMMAALRWRDLRRLSRELTFPLTRATLARRLLDALLPYLPGGKRRGFVALHDVRQEGRLLIEALTEEDLAEGTLAEFRGRRLSLGSDEGIWGQAVRTRRGQYLPDLPRLSPASRGPYWPDSQSLLAVPLITGDGQDCLGLIGLESGETSFAFSTQDQGFFETMAALAAIAAAGLRDPRLECPEAIHIPALLQRLRCEGLGDVPDDQIVRLNSICRALIKHRFAFGKAAEETRLSVHVLREYTSRSPRIIDVEALRGIAARQAESPRWAAGEAASRETEAIG
ncbi:MAG: GAF domain-containing protein [Candidatus Eisenbacteria bacterium]|uniref:GAF domain-containing protein n=1 Tax=Eiseniibacteriota bacterium TaxID=2212470 RepID=A0A938BRZ2_UNCEI|nr:GAF domain-containing protein [Candidatus Eisenbacteria bacterium]